jgi:hypothetical protein
MKGVVVGPGAPAGGLRLRLSHAPIDGGQRLLRTWELDSIPDQQAFRDLVEEIDSTAAEEAKELGRGMQRFTLTAETVDGALLGSVALRYAATTSVSGDSGSFLDSEPATGQGLVAMSMRQTNTAFQIAADAYRTFLDVVSRWTAQDAKDKARSQDTQDKFYDMMAKLADKHFEREVFAETTKKEMEMELHREIAQLDRSQMLMKLGIERVAPLVPAVLNRILGKGTVPAAPTPREEMMAGILETLSEEQLAGLQNVLTPSQLASLGMLFQDLRPGSGAAGPEAPAHDGRPSAETGFLALERIKRDLLPWAIEQIKAGQPLTPPISLATPTRIFKLLLGSISPQVYYDLISVDVAFNTDEREAFVKLAETFNLVPPPVQTTAAKK